MPIKGPKARIRLSGLNPKDLDRICQQIKEIANKTGVAISGPVPLPTRRLVIQLERLRMERVVKRTTTGR